MRQKNSQLRVNASAPLLPIKRDVMSGNPGESFRLGHMAAGRLEWLNQFMRPRKSGPDPTLAEIEARVRKELYP